MRRSPIVRKGDDREGRVVYGNDESSRVIYGEEPQIPQHGDVWIEPLSGKAVIWDEIERTWVKPDMEES